MNPLSRRRLIRFVAGATLAGQGLLARAGAPRIVIAGAGILGAQLAWRLAQRGADVTVLDRAAPAAVATACSFAWINAGWDKLPQPYFRLNRLGIEGWHLLEQELPGKLALRWGGSIEWYADETPAEALRTGALRCQSWGYPMPFIDAARIRALEPGVQPGPVTLAAHAEIEGHVDPVQATECLLAEARRAGARVQYPVEVKGIDERNGRLRAVKTTAGDIEADLLVIACGAATPELARQVGVDIPLKDAPGVLVHTRPLPPLLQRVVLAPVAHVKQKPDGRVVIGAGFEGATAIDASLEGARALIRQTSDYIPALANAEVDFVTVGFRPLPSDGFPVAGFAPGRRDVYLTVMHSGITLSPAIALLAASEMLDGIEASPLSHYRPQRFSS